MRMVKKEYDNKERNGILIEVSLVFHYNKRESSLSGNSMRGDSCV